MSSRRVAMLVIALVLGQSVLAAPGRGIAERLEELAQTVSTNATLAPEARDRALARLDEARRRVAQTEADQERMLALSTERLAAPALVAEVTSTALPEFVPPPADATVSTLEVAVAEADAIAGGTRTRLADLRVALDSHRETRLTIGGDLAAARSELAASNDVLTQARGAQPSATDASRIDEVAAIARHQAASARLALLEEQRLGLDAREQLLLARISNAEKELAERERHVDRLRELLRQAGIGEARALGSSIPRDLLERHASLRLLVESNRDLIGSRQAEYARSTQAIAAAREELTRIEKLLQAAEADFREVETRLTSLGRTLAAGALINETLADISNASTHQASIQARQQALRNAQLEQVALSRERKVLERGIDAEIEQRLADMPVPTDEEREALRQAFRGLLDARLRLLQTYGRSLEDYVGVLVELQETERQLRDSLVSFEGYLRSKQPWVPNAPAVHVSDLPLAIRGLASIGDEEPWRGWLSALRETATTRAPLVTIVVLGAIFAIVALRRLTLRLQPTPGGDGAERTARAPAATLGLALLRGACLGAAVWVAGFVLAASPSGPVGLLALGFALTNLSPTIFALTVVAHTLVRPKIVVAVLVPMVVCLVATSVLFAGFLRGVFPYGDLGARLTLSVGVLLLGIACHLGVRANRSDGSLDLVGTNVDARLRLATHWVLLAAASILAIAVIRGYLLATHQFITAILDSVALAAALPVAREAHRAWAATRTSAGETDEGVRVRRQHLERFLMTVLVGAALLWVWRDSLPSRSYLETVTLWSVAGANGPEAVTLANLVSSLMALAITSLAVWVLPTLAGTDALDTGSPGIGVRYAIVTLAKYTVGAIGVIVAFSMLDIGWSKLQWMAAGLSVGLGFGLQETVSNFVAGLLLLWERPVRVGDQVTVGTSTGIVSRIRMRATTLRDFDGRELIIPNKVLVTSEVTNWTLSNADRRIQVAVGVAYGSDVALVERLLLNAAGELPWKLRSPEPRVVFESFGDNALQFRLYLWIAGVERVLDTLHTLHVTIDRLFRAHGVEVSFPQRDVHLDSAGPLTVRLVQCPGTDHGEMISGVRPGGRAPSLPAGT